MDKLRADLIRNLDKILDQLCHQHEQQGSSSADLHIEASFADTHGDKSPRHGQKYRLGTVDIKQWRSWRQSTETSRDEDDISPPALSSESHPPSEFTLVDNPNPLPSPQSQLDGTDSSSDDQPTSSIHQPDDDSRPRRKMVGGLRLTANDITPPPSPVQPNTRQLVTDPRNFPKRRKVETIGPARLQPSTLDKLIEGVWEQIHKPQEFLTGRDMVEILEPLPTIAHLGQATAFSDISRKCRQLTGASRTIRALEVLFQAHWVDSYELRLAHLAETRPELRPHQHRKIAITEACTGFEWSEKELRNRMAIWRGYREIRDAAGWAALIFSGPGIYRFCKYRVGFDQVALTRLELLRFRFEVAADTIQPRWRQLLGLIGHPTQRFYTGHPHDWVVSKRKDPVPLANTYHQWDPNFSFRHVSECIIDREAWGSLDPRRVCDGPQYTCVLCAKPQSTTSEQNECECFADLFSSNNRRFASPVQVFRTEDGRNNGLIACCNFERGAAVGEFTGIVTKDLQNIDVMQEEGQGNHPYQIWQGRAGNFTRFINHSCQPNCQFQTFVWLGVQRIVVVSKGVAAGKELTVDYSGRYWQKLDKTCLCGEAGCRYKDRDRNR